MTYRPSNFLGAIRGVNLNVTTDQPITMIFERYIIRRIVMSNASLNVTTAAGGIYTAASKGGTAIVSASQVYTALSASTKYLDLTLETLLTTDYLSSATLYFSLTTAQGATATADLFIFGDVVR